MPQHSVDNDASDADADELINNALEQLYGSAEEKMEGINNVTSLLAQRDLTNDNLLEYIVESNQLMSALARLLGESSHHPIELTFGIAKIFFSLSMVEDFHQILSSHRVGALALETIELELRRASHRRGAESTATKEVVEHLKLVDRNTAFSQKQNNVILVCLSILDNLADDYTVLRKMIKRDLVNNIAQCFHQQQTHFMNPALSLLKKASIFEETAIELSSSTGCSVISQLVSLLSRSSSRHVAVAEEEAQQDAIVTLFNLSFHQDCAALISVENDVHSRLLALLQNPSLDLGAQTTLQLMYHLSSREEDRQKLYEAGITSHLIDLLMHTQRDIDAGFAGLLVNVSISILSCVVFDVLLREGYLVTNFIISYSYQTFTHKINKRCHYMLFALKK